MKNNRNKQKSNI